MRHERRGRRALTDSLKDSSGQEVSDGVQVPHCPTAKSLFEYIARANLSKFTRKHKSIIPWPTR